MKKKILKISGQTCNKFFGMLQALQDSVVNSSKYYIITIDKDLDKFPNLINNPYLKFPLYNKLIFKYIGGRKYETITKLINKIINLLLKKTNYIEGGWNNRFQEVDKPLYDIIKVLFKPKKEITTKVDSYFSSKNNKEIIIGLHLRRGDYKFWANGKFYYSDATWYEIIKKLTNMFNNPIKFLIVSNEKIDISLFEEFNIIIYNKNSSAIEDLYALSKCDYIVGPPSTYSTWAALYGKKPLSFIMDKDNIKFNFTIPTSIIDYTELEKNNKFIC